MEPSDEARQREIHRREQERLRQANGQPDGEVQVDAGVVAQTLAQRLGQREAEHSWELAVRDARIADLTRQLAAAHELIENARAQRDAQTDPADNPDHEEVPADA